MHFDNKRRRAICRICFAALGATATLSAMAQPYPAKPIRFVVPFAPGGGTDLLARAIGQRLTDVLGQPVVVDNRAGAGGVIGAKSLRRYGMLGRRLGLMVSGPGDPNTIV